MKVYIRPSTSGMHVSVCVCVCVCVCARAWCVCVFVCTYTVSSCHYDSNSIFITYCMYRLLQSLVDKGMVNVKIIQLPSKFVSVIMCMCNIQLLQHLIQEHSIYYHSNATETQLSEAIAEAQALYGFKVMYLLVMT